jgi:hypothetical protein
MWSPLADDRGRQLDLAEIAELPQLLRRSGVLEQNVIDVECVELTVTVTIEGLRNAGQ